eukprot:1087398-Rhodomonas_salina.1
MANVGMALIAARRSSSWQLRDLQDRDRRQSSSWHFDFRDRPSSSSRERETQDEDRRQSASYCIEREQHPNERRRGSSYSIRDNEVESSSETHSVAAKARLSIGSFRTVLLTEFPTEDILRSGILWKK